MTTLTLRLPTSTHQKIKELAKREGISINQFPASATAEKMSALLTKDYLKEEAKKAARTDYERVMNAVPDAESDEYDRLPPRVTT